MRPGGRIAAAMEVLAEVEDRHRPVSVALKDWGVAHRFAGSGDRAAIGNIVYDALRWRASSAWIMGEDTPRAVILATMGYRWRLGAAGLRKAFAGDDHAPPTLNDEEAARLDAADLVGGARARSRRLPRMGRAPARPAPSATPGKRKARRMALRPPLDMRANRLKATREEVLPALKKFGAVADAGLRPTACAYRRRKPTSVTRTCRWSRRSRKAASRFRTRGARSPRSSARRRPANAFSTSAPARAERRWRWRRRWGTVAGR